MKIGWGPISCGGSNVSEKQLEKYRALVVEAGGEKRRGVNIIIRRKDTTAETRPHLEE